MISARRMGVLAFVVGLAGSAAMISTVAFAPPARAEGVFQKLFSRIRGDRLPAGIVKANGRIEATQVDVSSKYAGRLAEVMVEEGSTVTQGQVIARLSSPEYEAQLRAAQASVQNAKDALAAAEAAIKSRESDLEFAKSDFERGQRVPSDRLYHQAGL